MRVITKLATNLNGITIAYVMGLANAVLACLLAFGVHLTDTQTGALAAVVNAVLILAVHVGHRVGEATASGAAHIQSVKSTTAQTEEHAPPESPPVAAG
jgi:hypothetical protein